MSQRHFNLYPFSTLNSVYFTATENYFTVSNMPPSFVPDIRWQQRLSNYNKAL